MNFLDVSYDVRKEKLEVIFQVIDPDRLDRLAVVFSSFYYYHFNEKKPFRKEQIYRSLMNSMRRRNISIRNSVFKALIDREVGLSDLKYLGKASKYDPVQRKNADVAN